MDRMKNEKWMICDRTRDLCVMYNGERYIEVPFTKEKLMENIEVRDEFDTLWKGFLESVTIPDRVNYKLQLNNMPKRYRKFMKEMY